MARRWSRVNQGGRLNTALQNRITYLQNLGTREPNLNSRGARGAQTVVYVAPYGADLGTGEIVGVRTNNEHFQQMKDVINGTGTQAQVVDSTTDTVVDLEGYRPARIVWFRNATRAVTIKQSEITKLKYLKYTGDRSSCPFGRKLDTDDIDDAFTQIKTKFLEIPSLEVNRVSMTPERFYN